MSAHKPEIMKRTVFIIIMLLTAAVSAFALGTPDTLAVLYGQDSTTRIRRQSDLDFDVPFYNKIKNKFSHSEIDPSGFGLGMIWTDAPAPFDFNMGNSTEFYFYALNNHRSLGNVLSYGVGVDWKYFTLTGQSRMGKIQDGSIEMYAYPEGTQPKFSRLRVFSFSFPILYSYDFGRGWGFTLGPVIQLNAGSKIKTKYWDAEGQKMKISDKKVHCNLATVDFMFQINLKDVSLFVKYSPFDLMDRSYWPRFQHFSVGIAL
jgi:hypothetical protein